MENFSKTQDKFSFFILNDYFHVLQTLQTRRKAVPLCELEGAFSSDDMWQLYEKAASLAWSRHAWSRLFVWSFCLLYDRSCYPSAADSNAEVVRAGRTHLPARTGSFRRRAVLRIALVYASLKLGNYDFAFQVLRSQILRTVPLTSDLARLYHFLRRTRSSSERLPTSSHQWRYEQRLLSVYPESRVLQTAALTRLLHAGNYHSALLLCSRLLEQNPADSTVAFYVAAAWSCTSHSSLTSRAQLVSSLCGHEHWQRFGQMKRWTSDALFNLGRYWHANGAVETARVYYRRVAELAVDRLEIVCDEEDDNETAHFRARHDLRAEALHNLSMTYRSAVSECMYNDHPSLLPAGAREPPALLRIKALRHGTLAKMARPSLDSRALAGADAEIARHRSRRFRLC